MSPTTQSLITYWRRLPAESRAVRKQHLAAVLEHVRGGRSAPAALVPFALADVDDEIVRSATAAYLEWCASGTPEQWRLAVEDTFEWIRRGLALNRGAVFSALLHTGDAAIDERLASQRLTLDEAEVATICRLLPDAPGRSALQFLREWLELLDGVSESRLRRQREQLAAAHQSLGGCFAPCVAA